MPFNHAIGNTGMWDQLIKTSTWYIAAGGLWIFDVGGVHIVKACALIESFIRNIKNSSTKHRISGDRVCLALIFVLHLLILLVKKFYIVLWDPVAIYTLTDSSVLFIFSHFLRKSISIFYSTLDRNLILILSFWFNHHVIKLKYGITSAFRCNSKWESFQIKDLRIWLSWVFFDDTTYLLWIFVIYHNNVYFFHRKVRSIKKRNTYQIWVMF